MIGVVKYKAERGRERKRLPETIRDMRASFHGVF